MAPQPSSPVGPLGPVGAMPTAAPGTRIGRYELRGLLGIGGMGAVYEARDAELDRAVALKVLRPELGETPGFADRLVRESRLMAKVTHPSVITVYDAGRAGGAVFIAMELIAGSTLTAWLGSHALDWRAIVSLFERAGQGLAAAHAAGIVHRDFKPDNVLVAAAADKVVVTDFGIAREAAQPPTGEAAAPARTGEIAQTPATASAVLGTPAYMAPEQITGRAVDHRADVFAFSASLWEALFDRRPFRGKTLGEIQRAMQAGPPRPPPGARRVPRRLLRALCKGLALEPRDRWPEMPALLAELAAIRTARRRIALAAAALGLVATGVGAALAVARPEPPIDRCARALAPLAQAFGPAQAAQIRAALAADPALAGAVVDRLGATARAWRATQIATCHADREVAQDAQVTACLDARLVELAGSVDDVIEHGAAGARYAVRIAGIPGSPAACASPAPGLLFAHVPADRELRRQVTALRDRIADAAERAGKGDLEQALHEVEQVAQASVIWAPMQAEAQYALGLNQRRSGDRKLGGTTLRAAAGTAERVHHDEVAANSWIVLSFATTFDDGDPPRGVEYITYAEAAADRIGRPAGVMVKLDYTKGVVLVQANRAREAEVALRAAFELAETVSPDDLSRTTQGLGVLYEDQGRYAEALDAYRKAIEHAPRDAAGQVIAPPIYFERVGANLALLGRPHEAEPEARHAAQLADRTLSETQIARPYTHVTLAQVLLDAGHPDEALREATAAAAIVAKTQGPRSERYGEALMIQGDILGYLGRYRQAEALLARACDIIAFTATDDDAESAACGVAHGSALVHVHRPNEALGKLDRATASLVRSHGEAHLWAAQALTARGSAHAAIGDHAQAIADFERAIAALAPRAIDPGYLATARGRLAQELWNDQPERARTEAATAERLFQTANARWATERAEQAAWRSHHTAGRR